MKQETSQNSMHKPFDAWRVPIERIPKAGYSMHQEVSKEVLNELVREDRSLHWSAVAPGNVQLHLTREAELVRLAGDGSFTLAHSCVRCLNDVEIALKLVFDISLLPMNEQDDDNVLLFDSFEDEVEDKHVHHFSGGEVNLLHVIREQLFIELPSYPTCEDGQKKVCVNPNVAELQQERSIWSTSDKAKLVALKEVINKRL